MKTTHTPSNPVDYLSLPDANLIRLRELIGNILQLRSECRELTLVSPGGAVPPQMPNGEGPGKSVTENVVASRKSRSDLPTEMAPRARSPMRCPTPGSLRAVIHGVLSRRGGAMRRAEIVAEVAREKGVDPDANLKAKIGDVLTSQHDPYFKKVSYGIYAVAKSI